MKKSLILLGSIIPILFNLSCKEDFSPKTSFNERIILNSYVDLDYDQYQKTKVYASLSRLYEMEGSNPSENIIDPTVSGPEVYVDYRDNTYFLKSDTAKLDTNRYGNNPIYYSSQSLLYIYPNNQMTIYVKFHNGKVISSSIQLLEAAQLKFSYKFLRYFTTKINRFLWGNAFTATWGSIENRLFFPKMYITYTKQDSTEYLTKEIPYTIINKSGKFESLYPSYTTGDGFSFDYASIDSAMVSISEGDENKENYTVLYINYDLIEMDESLSKYYLSIHGKIDNYTIRLDESVYNNIKGGIGIFGSRRLFTKRWILDYNYVHSFGYKSLLDPQSK